MSSEEDKPPAPPVRLTSCSCNRGNERNEETQVELKPLPKGYIFFHQIVKIFAFKNLI